MKGNIDRVKELENVLLTYEKPSVYFKELRENKNLEGELERSPFSSEMENLIDEYAKLEKELEEIENDYEMEIS